MYQRLLSALPYMSDMGIRRNDTKFGSSAPDNQKFCAKARSLLEVKKNVTSALSLRLILKRHYLSHVRLGCGWSFLIEVGVQSLELKASRQSGWIPSESHRNNDPFV